MESDFSDRTNRRRHGFEPADINKIKEGLAREDVRDEARRERLGDHFPELFGRLNELMKSSGADPVNWELASRQLISAEALLDVLAKRLSEGRTLPDPDNGEIVSAFGLVALDKLAAFQDRPEHEKELIQRVYPETDLALVQRGCEEGILDWHNVGAVLEEAVEYDAFLLRLRPPPSA